MGQYDHFFQQNRRFLNQLILIKFLRHYCVFILSIEDFETILQHAVEFFVLIIVAIINCRNMLSIDFSLSNKFQDFRLKPNQEPFWRHFCFTNNYFSDYLLIIVGLNQCTTN